MVKWEYEVITLDGKNCEEDKKLLDNWGKDGWELVSVVHAEGEMVPFLFAYFKKRKGRKN